MRFIEIMGEESPANTVSANLNKQADMKSQQSKQLKQQATAAKKREQVNSTRSKLLKQQNQLTKALNTATPAKPI